jgi:hypothetical protein
VVANVVTITFDTDQVPGWTGTAFADATLSGTIGVNYTTGTVSGSLTASDGSGSDAFSGFTFAFDSNLNEYILIAGGVQDSVEDSLIIEYASQQPTSTALVSLGLHGHSYAGSQPEPLSSAVDPAPVVTLGSQTLASDTGSGTVYQHDLITSDGHVTLTGAASAANGIAGVEIFNGTTDLGAATLSGGNWSFTTTLSHEGFNALRARATDTFGNTTETAAEPTIILDTTPPTIAINQVLGTDTGSFPTDRVTRSPAVTLSGLVFDANPGDSVNIYNGTILLGSAAVTGGSWTFATTLSQDGQYSLHAEATDIAGNRGVSIVEPTIVVDNTPPAVAITSQTLSADSGVSNSDRITNYGPVTLTGTASDTNSGFSVQIFDGTAWLGNANVTGGSWTFSTTLASDGQHALHAEATDTAGNTAATAAAPTITLDTTAPFVTRPVLIAASDSGIAANDGITNVTTPTVTGTLEAGSVVTLYDETNAALGSVVATDGTYAINAHLGEGTHALRVNARDLAGNTSALSAPLTVNVDTRPPTASLTAASVLSTSDATVFYTLSFSEPLSGAINLNNFALSTSAGIRGAAITGLSGGGGIPYTISVATGTGSGTIELNFDSANAGIQDLAANPLRGSLSGPVYLVRNVPTSPVHANDLTYSGTASGYNHLIDMPNFEASYADLIVAFGTNQQNMQSWYNANEPGERRVETFDGLDYVASYGDLIGAFASAGSMRAVEDAGANHYIANGRAEGRSTTFNGLDYIASYSDLIAAFGANADAGAYHYIEYGAGEGRTTTFDGLDYIASYGDLIGAFGTNEQAGAAHFVANGSHEGRTTTFDGLSYIAQHADLMNAFGANDEAGAAHYITNGFAEGRTTSFNVAAYEQAHPDLLGRYSSNDAFLTAYIDTYATTGHVLT